jgi:DNA-directed RNA polymerase subunit alpha
MGPVEETRAHLFRQGSGVVTAGDIDWPADLEVVNPDLVIATIDDDNASIEMDLVVSSGHGYQPAEVQEVYAIGEIPIDAIFTPIEKVNYVVEHTRVGHLSDYDRLIFEIQTDGTIEADDALSEAAKILAAHAQMIAAFKREEVEEEDAESVLAAEVDNRALADLGLSPRVLNALRSRQIETVGQVMAMDRDQLLSIRNFGPRSLRELTDALVENGYEPTGALAMDGDDEDGDAE